MLYLGRQTFKMIQWSFWFFRSTKISTFIKEDNTGVSTSIDTTAAFAWQRFVFRFPYMKKMLDLKTQQLQTLIWHNRSRVVFCKSSHARTNPWSQSTMSP